VTPAAGLAVATVLAQIGYPLVTGDLRDALTVATVLLFAAASLTHAAVTRGRRWAAGLLAVTAGLGLAVESVGVHTGVPFGDYSYAGTLGPALLGVPVVIPLAWTMMAYPALLVGRRIGAGSRAETVTTVTAGGFALASWDLFLDPQMVDAGHWTWTGPGLRLNGIPVVNHLGWLLAALVMVGLLVALLPDRPGDDRLPVALYLWTYASSLLANLVFFGRPGVALAGGLGMGVVVVLLVRTTRRPVSAR
jgi:carotene biosynthesis associated membrane protein